MSFSLDPRLCFGDPLVYRVPVMHSVPPGANANSSKRCDYRRSLRFICLFVYLFAPKSSAGFPQICFETRHVTPSAVEGFRLLYLKEIRLRSPAPIPPPPALLNRSSSLSVSQGFDQLRIEGLLCDVTLVAGDGDEAFPVHRAMMASSSDYFKAMFTGRCALGSRTSLPRD